MGKDRHGGLRCTPFAQVLPLDRRRDVLVEPEDIARVIATLDLSEPIPGRLGIGLAEPILALLAQEAHVSTALILTQSRCEIAYPRLARSPLLHTLIERGYVHHDACGAVGEGGSLRGYASHRPTQDPDLRHTHRCVGGPKMLEDRLRNAAVYGVDEHRARYRGRVEILLLRGVNLRVGHRLEHVDDRLGE